MMPPLQAKLPGKCTVHHNVPFASLCSMQAHLLEPANVSSKFQLRHNWLWLFRTLGPFKFTRTSVLCRSTHLQLSLRASCLSLSVCLCCFVGLRASISYLLEMHPQAAWDLIAAAAEELEDGIGDDVETRLLPASIL